MTHANHTTPIPTVMRSRLRSATDDPPRPLDTPPPNMSESPPPRPLWRSTSRIISKLVITSKTSKTITTVGSLTDEARQSEDGHVVEPADPAELVGLEAGTADETAVDVRLLHDPADVGGLHRTAVQDAYAGRGLVSGGLGDAPADRRAHLLRVVGSRDLAGADRPHRLVGDDQSGDLLGGESGERAVDLGEGVLDLPTFLAYVEPLADADDRGHPSGQCLVRLRVHQGVVLGVVLTSLGVPDDHVGATELGEHRRRDL